MFSITACQAKEAGQHRRIVVLTALVVLTLSTLVPVSYTQSRGVIDTIAGIGVPGFSGDGGPAVDARLNPMQGLAVNGESIYIADTANHVVRRVNLGTGIITRVAGLGPDQAGFNGDNQPASQARLSAPTDVTIDAEGNLYIADNGNNRIRKVDLNGIITTVGGGGNPIDGLGDGGLAVAARLANPAAIALDGVGNLFISDVSNHRVRRIDRFTGIMTTFAGNGQPGSSGDGGPATAAQLGELRGLAVAATGDVFVADFQNQRVRRVDTNGIITTVAGNGVFLVPNEQALGDGGPATEAVVRWPIGVALDAAGNLYIAENASNRVRRVDINSGIITTVAGSGNPRVPGFSGDGGPATNAKLNGPGGVTVDLLGNVYISDSGNFRVRMVTPL